MEGLIFIFILLSLLGTLYSVRGVHLCDKDLEMIRRISARAQGLIVVDKDWIHLYNWFNETPSILLRTLMFWISPKDFYKQELLDELKS